MFNPTLKFAAIAASVLLGMPMAHAEKTAGQMVDDTTLATTTKAALIDSDKVSANHINVEVYKGHVQLGGFVDSDKEKAAAVAAARKVEGVVKVHDAMAVMKGHRSLGQAVDDGVIQTELKAKLVDLQGLEKGIDINTEVKQGHVLLSGWVTSEKSRDQAGQIARSIKNVKQVHNYLALKP